MDPSFIKPTGPRWYKARGSWINGRILDFRSGVMTASMGHAPWRLAWPMIKALLGGMGQAWYSPNAIRDRAHRELSCILPPLFNKTVFVVTGSEAVEVACRSAMHLRPGQGIAHLRGNYHGSTTWVQENLNGEKGNWFEWGRPYPLKRIGVVIITPYLAAWCKWGEPQDVADFVKWVKGENIIVIDDEIQAGFGRCGMWWGFQRYADLQPHIIVAGKAATGLLPLSFISYRDDIAGLVPEEDYISTHSGNPICLAAMNANVEWMRKADAPGLALAIKKIITRWAAELTWKRLIETWEGYGAAVSVYVKTKEIAKQVIDAVADRVLLFDTGLPLIKIAPPLNIKHRGLERGLGIIREALTAVGG